MFDDITRINEIKRRVRKLKHFELNLRFNKIKPPGKYLVWDKFFDLHSTNRNHAKYSLNHLLSISQEEYKTIINEYLSYVYYEHYQEKGISSIQSVYSPTLLSNLGLPFDANEHDIKKRFRELANKYHPDKGGDAKMFIELMETYKKLLGR